MVRSRVVVAERFGTIPSQKYRTGAPYFFEVREWVVNAKLQMFGGDRVRDPDRFVEVGGDNYFTVFIYRFSRDLRAQQPGDLLLTMGAGDVTKIGEELLS